ncbi:MAG: hypothetical protein QOG41_1053, partial [Thermoleophilaceae bacterium]|nr:hypothetical protein [Thermoleophilaceae bacterium]
DAWTGEETATATAAILNHPGGLSP